MTVKNNIPSGMQIATKLKEKGLIPDRVKRIVIDIQIDNCVTIYYETVASENQMDVVIEQLMKNKENIVVKEII